MGQSGKNTVIGGVSTGIGAISGQAAVIALTRHEAGHAAMLALARYAHLPTVSYQI